MKVIVTREQFIKAHMNYVNSKEKDELDKFLGLPMSVSVANQLFLDINTLFVFDIKHVEIDFIDFSYLAPFWPKKKN
uniref:Head protein n=1 Tax=Aeromonas phage vB_AdhaM_G2 TaxID=3238786 RepID=A0AB39TZE3_9CAUD